MNVCALPPRSAMVEQRPLLGIEDGSLVQGPVGQVLQDRFEEVLRHWYEPAERILETTRPMDEEITYDPVPAKRVYTVRVKYRAVDQGQPFPYPLEE